MPIAVFPIGPLETNAYVVHDSTDAVIIDAGGDLRGGLTGIIDFIGQHRLQLRAVLLTHMHFDHVLGVAQLVDAFPGVTVYAAPEDDFILQGSFSSRGNWGMPAVAPFAYEPLTVGEHSYGTLQCTVFATPGHTPGSVSMYFPAEQAVMTGDLLFYRSVGRTDLPGSDHQQLIHSLQTHIYTLPPATLAYSGHGPETVVGDEKLLNPFVRG